VSHTPEYGAYILVLRRKAQVIGAVGDEFLVFEVDGLAPQELST
jgi:hypothetical protein